jgi:flagellar hook-associated protein 2
MSSLSGLNGSGISFSGLATGMDTDKIIAGLTSFGTKRIEALRKQQVAATSNQAVFTGLQGKLNELQGTVSRLARSVAGAFEGRKVSSSDDTLLTGVGSSTAQNGTYALRVDTLAQAHQVGSAAVADPTTALKTGTVDLKVGGTTTTITVDSSNNTLQGLAQSINDSDADVSASVVGDGTGYRLLLTSGKTGQANAITITNNLTTGAGESPNFADRLVQAATDAKVTLGTGPGAIAVTSSTNKVDNLIAGVTLTLTKADPAKTVTVNVTADTEAATTAVDDFVKAYNSVIDFIDARDNYDAQTQTAGILLGNRDVAELRNELAGAVSSAVGGLNPKMNRMSAVGLTFNDKGRVQFDSGKLTSALNGGVAGVTGTDVKRLFALSGTSTNGSVSFLLGGSKTQATPTGQTYGVNVTSVATRANVTGASALAGTVNIDGTNNSFNIKVNSLAASLVTIEPGSYTPAALAAAIQSQLATQYGSSAVAVNLDAGRLQFTSQLFGSGSRIEFAGGSALATLGFSGSEIGAGTNVAGSFVVNGKTELASGSGQVLIGSGDNAFTSGMQVKVGLTADLLNGNGNEAELTVTQGLASRLGKVLDRFTDPVDGRFKTIDDRFKKSVETIEKTITKEQASLTLKQQQLLRQFAGVESTVSSLKNIGSQIAASFGVLQY